MTRLTTHLAYAMQSLWTLSIGLFLGFSAGMVLGVIQIFRGSRDMQAIPGLAPFNDPRFEAYYAEAVAGATGQELFSVGGVVLMVLLGVAFLGLLGGGLISLVRHSTLKGSAKLSSLRVMAFTFCVLCMIYGGKLTRQMNTAWPGLYDLTASDAQIDQRRADFEAMHQQSEKVIGSAWLAGLFALVITPWCRQVKDVPMPEHLKSKGAEDA